MRPMLFVVLIGLGLFLIPGLSQKRAPLEDLLVEEKSLMALAGKKPEDSSVVRRLAGLRAEIAVSKTRDRDYRGALDYLYSSVRLDGTSPERWEQLGDLAAFIPEGSSPYVAQYAYEEALRLAPERASVRAKLAGSYASTERFTRAIEELEKLIRETRGRPDWNHIGLLVGLYALQDGVPRGVRFFESQSDTKPDSRFSIALAILENARGQTAWAVTALRSVLAREPAGSPEREMATRLETEYRGGQR